jgi:hypothetical protein
MPPRNLSILLPLAVAVLVSATAGGVAAGEPVRVGTITVRTLDVYTAGESESGWPYRAAAAVHVKTRESVIRKFLLFHEGDPYEPERLVETERNLRSLRFIKRASVVAGPAHDGVVDVTVTTQDTWTTEPSLAVSRKGGVSTFGASLTERDLLGSGRELEIAYDEETTRISRSFMFTDPNLFGPYRKGWVFHSENSDGQADQGGIERPFSSVSTARSGALLYDVSRGHERIYRNGAAVSEYRQQHWGYRAEFGFALHRTPVSARRLSVGLLWLEDRFRPLPGREDDLRPEDRRHRYLFLRAEAVSNDLVKVNYVDRDSRFQDYNLGWRVSALLGLSPAVGAVARATGLASAEASVGAHLGPETFLLNQLALQSRIGDPRANAVLQGEARLVHRFGTHLPQTLVARLSVARGWDLDRDVQFFADGDTGLRAYPLWAYEGDRRVILNVEHRVFSGRELFRIVSPGAAIFVDTGAAVSEGSPFRPDRMKSDVGAGLRLALPRAAVHNLFRIDAAWPLSPGPDGRRDVLFSFSSSQAF